MRKEALLGLSKLLAKEAKKVRDDVQPGEHRVNATIALQVYGTLKVADDQQYIPTVSIPHKAALALFVRYCGVTREKALEALEQAMCDALENQDENSPKAAELLAAMADLEEAEDHVQATLEQLPLATRKGNVSIAGLGYEEIRPTAKKTARKSKKAA